MSKNTDNNNRKRDLNRSGEFVKIEMPWFKNIGLDLSIEHRGIAFTLMYLCYDEPANLGRFKDALSWSARKWATLNIKPKLLIKKTGGANKAPVGINIENVCHWENSTLVVDCCPPSVKELMDARIEGRENGQKGVAAKRGDSPQNIAPPQAPPQASPLDYPRAECRDTSYEREYRDTSYEQDCRSDNYRDTSYEHTVRDYKLRTNSNEVNCHRESDSESDIHSESYSDEAIGSSNQIEGDNTAERILQVICENKGWKKSHLKNFQHIVDAYSDWLPSTNKELLEIVSNANCVFNASVTLERWAKEKMKAAQAEDSFSEPPF